VSECDGLGPTTTKQVRERAMPSQRKAVREMGTGMGRDGETERRKDGQAWSAEATMTSVQCAACSVQRAASVLT
jgi:hypothetical protein